MNRSPAVVLAMVLACSSTERSQPAQALSATTSAPPPAPTPLPPPPAPDGLRLFASEIRVAWSGAAGASASVLRSPDEAQALAGTIRQQLTTGASFAALAASASDAPSAGRGGQLGPFETPLLDAALEAELAATPIGAITLPVRTAAGFHVLRREPLDEPLVRWIALGWTGAHRATVRRSREEAERLAQQGADRLAAGAVPSTVEADARGPDDGERVGASSWPPRALAAVYALHAGQVTTIETSGGLWVVQRLPTPLPTPP